MSISNFVEKALKIELALSGISNIMLVCFVLGLLAPGYIFGYFLCAGLALIPVKFITLGFILCNPNYIRLVWKFVLSFLLDLLVVWAILARFGE